MRQMTGLTFFYVESRRRLREHPVSIVVTITSYWSLSQHSFGKGNAFLSIKSTGKIFYFVYFEIILGYLLK